MCQLLGLSAAEPTSFSFSFRGFAQRGGCSDKHCDGRFELNENGDICIDYCNSDHVID